MRASYWPLFLLTVVIDQESAFIHSQSDRKGYASQNESPTEELLAHVYHGHSIDGILCPDRGVAERVEQRDGPEAVYSFDFRAAGSARNTTQRAVPPSDPQQGGKRHH